jgi:hypothetical protein
MGTVLRRMVWKLQEHVNQGRNKERVCVPEAAPPLRAAPLTMWIVWPLWILYVDKTSSSYASPDQRQTTTPLDSIRLP